jgi:hypothetical protein
MTSLFYKWSKLGIFRWARRNKFTILTNTFDHSVTVVGRRFAFDGGWVTFLIGKEITAGVWKGLFF